MLAKTIQKESEMDRSKRIWKNLINDLLERDEYFDLVNNVLSSKVFGENVRGVWFWFGNLRLAMEGQTRAGEMHIIDGYDFNEDGTMNFHINPHLGE